MRKVRICGQFLMNKALATSGARSFRSIVNYYDARTVRASTLITPGHSVEQEKQEVHHRVTSLGYF
jgi:hypothetical protein